MSREEVLLQWERKIEAAERRPGGSTREATGEGATVEEPAPRASAATARARPSAPEDSTHEGAQRFERARLRPPGRAPHDHHHRPADPGAASLGGRRQLAQPDPLALWAFLLGLFLVAVAAGTAHA